MSSVNQVYTNEVCSCKSCFAQGRLKTMSLTYPRTHPNVHPFVLYGFDGLKDMHSCIVKKCLIIQVRKLGLDILEHDMCHPNTDQKTYQQGCDLDCHVVIMITDGYEWSIAYGARLPKTNFHSNPDLEKLKLLFEMCQDGAAFFVDGQVDYSD
jgi:hypothetical protein